MSSKLNLSVLQRLDSNIVEVLDTAAHVTVYIFQGEWKKKDVEGSLFIVKRSNSPHFQLIVMNRLSTMNMIDDISGQFQLQKADPYVIYKNSSKEINGIWFYSSEEREAITRTIERIIQSFTTPTHSPNSTISPTTSTSTSTPTFTSNSPLSQNLVADITHSLLSPNRSSANYLQQSSPPKLMTKQQIQSALFELVRDDSFIDKVYLEYLTLQNKQHNKPNG